MTATGLVWLARSRVVAARYVAIDKPVEITQLARSLDRLKQLALPGLTLPLKYTHSIPQTLGVACGPVQQRLLDQLLDNRQFAFQ